MSSIRIGQLHSKRASVLLSRVLFYALVGAIAVGCVSEDADSTAETKEAVEVSMVAVAEGDAALNTVQTTSQTTPNNVSRSAKPARLSRARLDLIDAELGSSETLIRDQSFAVNLSGLGIVDFVPSKAQADNGSSELALRWRDLDGNYVPLYLSNQWQFHTLSAVAFEDINKDGLGPDVVAIAQYITGIGPDGAKPFPAATVLFNDGSDRFEPDSSIDNMLAERGAATVADVRTLLASASPGAATETLSSAPSAPLALQDLTAGSYARLKAKEQFCVGYVCKPSQRRYELDDAMLTSSVGEVRVEVSLIPDAPISREDAIAYGKILSGEVGIIFTNSITERIGDTSKSEIYFPPKPADDGVPHTGYSVRFELTDEGQVSKITSSSVTL